MFLSQVILKTFIETSSQNKVYLSWLLNVYLPHLAWKQLIDYLINYNP